MSGLTLTPTPTARPTGQTPQAPETPEEATRIANDAMTASFRLARDDDEYVNAANISQSYKAVEDALKGIGYSSKRYDALRGEYGPDPLLGTALFQDVQAARAADPKRFADVPKTLPEFQTWAARRRGARDADELAAARGSWSDRLPGQVGAGLLWAAQPENWAQLLAGGSGRTVAGIASREFLTNASLAAIQTPQTAVVRQSMGESYTADEGITDVLTQGAIGSALGTGLRLAPRVLSSLNPRRAAEMTDPELARHFGEQVGPGARTPDEQAALHVINRQTEVDAVNPFVGTPDAHDLHAARLREAIDRVMQPGPEGEAAARAADTGTPMAALAGPRETPYAAPFETAWKAIIGNEGGTDKSGRFLTSPAGAIGPAQVMPATAPHAAKLAGVPFDDHLYRTDPAYNDKLGRAYYAELLRQFDGDAEKAAAAYNAGPGSAKTGRGVRGAMARAEQAGRPEAWRDFLPAETRAYIDNFRRRTGGAAVDGAPPLEVLADDPFAAQRNADLIAERPIAPEGETEAIDAMSVRPEPPQLRRDLFPDEASWRTAQDLHDAEWRGDLVEPDVAPPVRDDNASGEVGPVTEFTTAKGSTYTLHEDGTTTRDKSYHPEHGEADQGMQPRSESTFFVTPEDASKLGEFQAQGGGRRAIAQTSDGRWGVKYLDGKDAGKFERRTVVSAAAGPAPGLTPVETFKGGERVHFGNPVTEMRSAPREVMPAGVDRLEAPLDRTVAAVTEEAALTRPVDQLPFREPAGTEAVLQADRLFHDLKIDAEKDATMYQLADGESASVADVIAAFDADDAAIAALKACL